MDDPYTMMLLMTIILSVLILANIFLWLIESRK
jgi:hypothetical protein